MDETLLTEEEREVSSEVDNFFRVPLDQRTLNYETYFTVGSGKVEQPVAFTSGNTYRLSVDEIAQILMENREMQEILKGLKK
jgi:UDP-glucose 4-epimerase